MLTRYQSIADAIALLFAPHAEVAIHDVAHQQLVYIANNRSQRQIGEDSNLDDLQWDKDTQVFGPYLKRQWDGSQCRSISAVLRDAHGQVEGLLCINLDISALEGAKAALELLLSGASLQPQPVVLFQDDWQERINDFIHQWLQQQQLSLNNLHTSQRRALISALQQQGAFKGKNSTSYVARVIGIGRATLYNYLKESKDPQ